jgi:ABC-type nitrate/sulfonate/bicarbonate transport system substrate-binding protein
MLVALATYVGGTAGTAFASKAPAKKNVDIAPATVTLALNGPPLQSPLNSYAFFQYAAKLDKEFNTNIQQSYYNGSASALSAVESGAAQFTMISANSQLNADVQGTGQNLVSLMALGQGGGANLYGAEKYKSFGTGVKAVAKYVAAGLPWAIPGIGGSGQFSLNLALQANHISPSTVTEEAVGNGTAAAIVNGKVGAGVSTATAAQSYVDAGQIYLLFDASGEQAYNATGFMVSSTLMTTHSFTKQYPAFTEALTLAMLKAEQYFQAHPKNPDLIFNGFPSWATTGTTIQSWDSSWPFTRSNYQPITGLVNQAIMRRLAAQLIKNSILPSNFVLPNDSADPTFLDEAYKAEGKTPPTLPMVASQLHWLSKAAIGTGA